MRTLILCVAAFVAVQSLPVDPDAFDVGDFCFVNGAMGSNLYSHPDGCAKYIMCLKMSTFVRGWTFTCAPETYFVQEKGACVHIQDAASCFNTPDTIPVKPRAGCNLYDMQATNPLYMELHEVNIAGGKAEFAGSDVSYFKLPLYAGNDFRNKMEVELKFKNLVAGGAVYIPLFKNDAMEIAVTNAMVRITLSTSDTEADAPCTIEAPFPPSIQVFPIEREILVKYDGKNLNSLSNGIAIGSASCTGDVVSAAPVTIGRGFKGTIADLMICKTVV